MPSSSICRKDCSTCDAGRHPGVRMRIDVFTIFPAMVDDFASQSLIGKARANGVLDVRAHDVRSGANDPHRSVDDSPYGGGAGMVLMPEPLFRAVESVPDHPRPLYLLGPGGKRLDHAVARDLAGTHGFSLLCGRYEGVDARVREHLVDDELSIGDYVLGGGEVAAMVVLEVVARLIPGVMGNEESAADESFVEGLLEYPQYTRPATYRGWDVPEVLRSGDHARVERWRRAQAIARTLALRPDLVDRRGGLTEGEAALLERELGITYPAGSPEHGPGADAP